MLSDMSDLSKIVVGTCGWSFEDWRGVLYPTHLPSGERLEFYSRHFGAVEVDSTFYGPPSMHAVAHWLDSTPDAFRFTIKAPREITHERKLRNVHDHLNEFLAALAPLRRKIACVLLQLPPHFSIRHDESALREFVRELPEDFRFAVEFRNPDWQMPRIAHLLEAHRICWVWSDATSLETQQTAAFGFLPTTTDFLYLRLLGDLTGEIQTDGSGRSRYVSLQWPRDASVESWAARLRLELTKVGSVLAFAGNHFEGYGPESAVRVARQFGLPAQLPSVDAGTDEDGQIPLL